MPRAGVGISSYELAERAVDREDQLRAAALARPSASTTLRRCQACGHWAGTARRVRCDNCRLPYEPEPLVGLAVVHGSR